MQTNNISTEKDEFYNSHKQFIDSALTEYDADEYRDKIIYLLYFLDKFDTLLAKELTESSKNSFEYFKNLIKRYVEARRRVLKSSLHKAAKIGETIPDQMVRLILLEYENQNSEVVKKYIDGHVLAMSAENLLGYLLEAYIAKEIGLYRIQYANLTVDSVKTLAR